MNEEQFNITRNREKFDSEKKSQGSHRRLRRLRRKNPPNPSFSYQNILFEGNPQSVELEENIDEDSIDTTSPQVVSADQMSLQIKHSKKEMFYKVKRKITDLETMLEIIPFWKNFLSVFTIIVGFATPGLMGILIYQNYSSIKEKVPLFYIQSEQAYENIYDKSLFLVFPVIILAFNLIHFRFLLSIYKFDRKYVNVSNFAILLLNVLVFLSFTQILFLVI